MSNDVAKHGQVLPPQKYEPEQYPLERVLRPPQGNTRLAIVNRIVHGIRRRETAAWNSYVEETVKTKHAYYDLVIAERDLQFAVDSLKDGAMREELRERRQQDLHRARMKFPWATRLPLHRQGEMFARLGIDIPRSTLISWTGSGRPSFALSLN